MNKNLSLFLMFITIILVSASCKSTKEFTLFQDMKEIAYLRTNLNDRPPKYKIKVFDNLYINISTTDNEVNQMLNPGLSGGGNVASSLTSGSGVGQFIDGYHVIEDSTISVPILGDIKIAGFTLEEAENLIRVKAEEYLKNPSVQVKLLNFRLNVLGEVNSPGIYYNYEGAINIIDALGMAGGTSINSNLKKVVVNRQIDNVNYSYKVDLTNTNLYRSDVYYLQPYDVVYVPPSKKIMRSENLGTYSIIVSTLTSLLLIFNYLGTK